ncbi:hypothetical protein ACLHK8_01350 [Pediococcus sp. M21F004]|uniref:hypothetical protein n=1 Tax=Pediococcus sp. M21F004 TaxID=3390033 RepID=UPI003DA76882
MKLVKIENKWINPDAIEVIDKLDGITVLVMRSNNTITIQQPIEKVLQAIEGSQEHLDDKQYLQLKSEIDEAKGYIASLQTAINSFKSN